MLYLFTYMQHPNRITIYVSWKGVKRVSMQSKVFFEGYIDWWNLVTGDDEKVETSTSRFPLRRVTLYQ